MGKLKYATLVAVAAALVMSGSPSASAAGETAYNTREQFIVKFPDPDARSCIDRRIYLASGWYTWKFADQGSSLRREIYLAAGWYSWQDCLTAYSRVAYTHLSQLDPDNAAYETVKLSEIWEIEPRDGWNLWGSSLTPALA
ncbi:hypothetical protein GCM10010222_80530 [Streptomyces tanashiensis]|nr:hypothetical protein GCM10010222_80530 [Streptomyces tanashiensis]